MAPHPPPKPDPPIPNPTPPNDGGGGGGGGAITNFDASPNHPIAPRTESQLAVVPCSSISNPPLAQPSFPIRTKIGTDESKKYELRAYIPKAGLYYSSVIWPEELPHQNYMFLSGQLHKDLDNHIQNFCTEKRNKRVMKTRGIRLTDQAFSIELRLSGNLHANNEDIELRPTVWIICASEFCKELVSDALSQPQLEWVEENPTEVVGGLTFLKRREQVDNLDLSGGICFMDSYRLHLHTEEAGEDNSACGLVTCATLTKNGHVIDQCISRLGGLILLNNENVCGSSTAHGILDMLMSVGIYSTEDEDDCSSDFSDSEPEIKADPEKPRIAAVSSITGWNVVPQVIILDFVRMASPGPNQIWKLSTEVNAHDFVLFKIGNNDFTTLSNSYEYGSMKHLVTAKAAVTPVGLGVTILLGYNRLARGRILPGISMIRIAGVEFSTMRILLHDPLAPGTSGSWVVSGSDLHGIIITSYGQDPMAQMITARQLFSDIVSALPAGTSINLPSGTSLVNRKQKSTKAEQSASKDTTAKPLEPSSLSEIDKVATLVTRAYAKDRGQALCI
ncbi:hypothetical protein F4803DRAFT_529496 [Xylaria telfairii]|nr:hypothetical protein F4803DRAFT_529496 [Xylaria telfairii]